MRSLLTALYLATLMAVPTTQAEHALHPPITLFQLAPQAIGRPAPADLLPATKSMGEERGNSEGISYEEYYYGVAPKGFPHRGADGLYYVRIFSNDRDASNANLVLRNMVISNAGGNPEALQPITVAQRINSSQWVAVLQTGQSCSRVLGSFAYRNLQLSAAIAVFGSGTGCKGATTWLLDVERRMSNAITHYATTHH